MQGAFCDIASTADYFKTTAGEGVYDLYGKWLQMLKKGCQGLQLLTGLENCQSMLGSLIFFATRSSPNISFAVSRAATLLTKDPESPPRQILRIPQNPKRDKNNHFLFFILDTQIEKTHENRNFLNSEATTFPIKHSRYDHSKLSHCQVGAEVASRQEQELRGGHRNVSAAHRGQRRAL